MRSQRTIQEQLLTSHQHLRDDHYQALENSLLQFKSILKTPNYLDIFTSTKIPNQRQSLPRFSKLSPLKKRDDEIVCAAYHNLAESISEMNKMMKTIGLKQFDSVEKRDNELIHTTYDDLAENIQHMRQMFQKIKGQDLAGTCQIEKRSQELLDSHYGDLQENISQMKQILFSLKEKDLTGMGTDETGKIDRDQLTINYHDLEESIENINSLFMHLKQKGYWTDEAEKRGQETLAAHYEDIEKNIGNIKEMLNIFHANQKMCISAKPENNDAELMEKAYSNLAKNIDEIMEMMKSTKQKDLIDSVYSEITENINQITQMFNNMKQKGLMSQDGNGAHSESKEDSEFKEWKVIDKISENIDQQFNRFFNVVEEPSEDEKSSDSSFKIAYNPNIKICQINKIEQQIGEITFLQENQYHIATDFQLMESEQKIQPHSISQSNSQDLSPQHQKSQLQNEKSPSEIQHELQLNLQGLSEVEQPHLNSPGVSINSQVNAIESENLYSQSGFITDRSMILKRNDIFNKYEGESSVYFNEESVPVGKYFEAIQQKQKQKEALKNYEEQRQTFEESKRQQDENMRKLSQQLEQYKALYQGQKIEAQKKRAEAQKINELYSNLITYTSDLTNNYENRITYLTETLDKKQEEIKVASQKENDKIQELYNQIESLKSKIVEEKEENQQISANQQRQLEALYQEYISARNMMMVIENQKAGLKKQNDGLMSKIQELQAKNTNLYSAIEHFQHKNNAQDTRDEIDEVYTFQYSKLIQELENTRKQVGQLQFQNSNLSQALKRVNQQIEVKDQQISILEQKLSYQSSKRQPLIHLQAAVEQQMTSLRRQSISQLQELERKEQQIYSLHQIIESIIKESKLSIDIASVLQQSGFSSQSNGYLQKLQEYREKFEQLMSEKKETFEFLQNCILSEMGQGKQSQLYINKIKSIFKEYRDAPQRRYQPKRDKFDGIHLFQVETAENTNQALNDSARIYRKSRIFHQKFSQIKLVQVENKSPKSGKMRNGVADEILQVIGGKITTKDKLKTAEESSQNEDTLDLSEKQQEGQQAIVKQECLSN